MINRCACVTECLIIYVGSELCHEQVEDTPSGQIAEFFATFLFEIRLDGANGFILLFFGQFKRVRWNGKPSL
ncbi:hypothetical protein ABIC86_003933 [Paenibacillus sp. DS2363]